MATDGLSVWSASVFPHGMHVGMYECMYKWTGILVVPLYNHKQRKNKVFQLNFNSMPTFHTLVDRLIISVCPSLWPLSGLNQQDGMRLHKQTIIMVC